MPKSSAKPKVTAGSRLEPDARRAHLLEIGAAAFADHPFDEVQIDRIAQLAGVSRGLLYHYFPNKRDFFAEIVRSGCADILSRTTPNPGLPGPERLRASLDAYLDYVEQHPKVYRAVFRGAGSSDTRIAEIVNNNLDQQTKRLIDGLNLETPANGVLRIAVRAWMAFVIHAVLDWMDRESAVSRSEVRDLAARTLESAIQAALGSPLKASGA
ncbi:TetR/AcrR family transcriptional regulator [Pseudomonas paralcaligenes]|uniref:TetR/AcrR family transcriptional regulator n=1 Tax=Pseudomonas paralcaligenes TaxID=2772558 RepID=UPI001C7E2C7C|nr:TetR/AcrR family transcriptional regulator [Pseudomonas paralcaligenes]